MSKILLIYYGDMKEKYQLVIDDINKLFSAKGITVEELGIHDNVQSQCYVKKLQEKDNEYICSLDMAGFQLMTLLNTYVYNILYAKQLHLVLHDNIFPMFSDGEFALNLFIYLPEREDTCRGKYSHIPNLVEYQGMLMTSNYGEIQICSNHEAILQKVVDDFLNKVTLR